MLKEDNIGKNYRKSSNDHNLNGNTATELAKDSQRRLKNLLLLEDIFSKQKVARHSLKVKTIQ